MLILSELIEGVIAGERASLAKAITLIESTKPADQELSYQLLQELEKTPKTSIRISISGSPGVGKSTLIESLGKYMIDKGYKTAVLSIDPSSTLTKGSILGDKTRMDELSKNPNAFIRPTASGGKLGGVSDKTREVMLLCEAAGFDLILVETVGVGQSEIESHSMTDLFMLLILPNSGDTLQGIKKGIVEMADLIVVNKADGDNITNANRTKKHYNDALHLFPKGENGWIKSCISASGLEVIGLDNVWQQIQNFTNITRGNGHFDKKREEQNLNWFNINSSKLVNQWLEKNDELNQLKKQFENKIKSEDMSITKASKLFLETFKNRFNK